MSPRIYCAPSRIQGYGVFTRDFISKSAQFNISRDFLDEINAQGHHGINDSVNGNITCIAKSLVSNDELFNLPKDELYELMHKRQAERGPYTGISYRALRDIRPNEELTLPATRDELRAVYGERASYL